MPGKSSVDQHFDRVYAKLDELNEAVVMLARIEERLITQTDRAEWLGKRVESLDSRVSALELSRAKFMGAVMVVSGLGSCAWPLIQKLFGV